MPATRKLSSQELQLVIMFLLTEQESYGEQLSERIAGLSASFYYPSPGVLYPALAALKEKGHLGQNRQGRKKFYFVTDSGHEYFRQQWEAANDVVGRLRRAGLKYEALREVMHDIAEGEQAELLAAEFLEARMNLKSLLFRSQTLPQATQRQIIEYLNDASHKIANLMK